MKKLLSIIAAIALPIVASCQVTTNEPSSGVFTNTPIGSVIGFAFSILPQLDRTATAFTNGTELEIKVAPLWKTSTAAGSTPYLSAGADYWFKTWTATGPNGVNSKSIGIGGELVTLGDGSGNDTVDSASVYFEARAALGNVAGYVMIGAQRDIANDRFAFEFGPGVEIRYKTGLGLFLDTRLVEPFEGSDKGGDLSWMTRFGASFHF